MRPSVAACRDTAAARPGRSRRRRPRRPRRPVPYGLLLLPPCLGGLHEACAAEAESAESPEGEAPSYVTCEGEGYPVEWRILKEELVRAASQPGRQLRDTAAWDERVQAAAVAGTGLCTAAAAGDFSAAWTKAYWAIRRSAEAGEAGPGSAEFGLLSPWFRGDDERGGGGVFPGPPFCLCGCAAALWVTALHNRTQGNVEEANSIHLLAQVLVGLAVPWSLEKPYRWGDAFAPAFGRWGGWIRPTVEEMAESLPYYPLGEPERDAGAPDAWPPHPTLQLQHPGALALLRWLQPCDPLRDVCRGQQAPTAAPGLRPVAVDVTAVGHHAAGLLAFAATLRRAAEDLGFRLRLRYAGSFYLCQVLRDAAPEDRGEGDTGPCRPDAMKAFLREWLEDAPAAGEEGPGAVAAHADRLRGALAEVEAGRGGQLYVCLDQVLFCWLLRRRARDPVVAPMLIGVGMGLLEDVPVSWRDEVAADFAAWVGETGIARRAAAPGDLIWTCNQHIVLQAFWQLGVVLPWVDTPGLAFWSGALHSPPPAGARPALLVLRSSFWRLAGGHVLHSLLVHLLGPPAGSQEPVADVRWMDSFLRGSLESEGYRGSWVSFADLAKHTAALYMPSELYQIRFRDMYSMGVPILAPEAPWALRTLQEMFRMWGMVNKDGRQRPPDCPVPGSPASGEGARWCVAAEPRREADGWPFGEPFVDPDRDPAGKLAFYYTLADAERYPHVLHFASLAGVLAQLRAAQRHGPTLGALMRDHFRETVVGNALRFCREAAELLLTPAPGRSI